MTHVCDHELRHQIRRCTAEISARLPELSNRHTPLVLVAALTEHVGGSLFLTRDSQLCTPETARAIIDRVREIAFYS